MRRILLMALSILFLISTAACANEGQVYENQQYGFRITLPDDWSIQESQSKSNQIVEAISPIDSSKLTVFISPSTLDDNNQDELINKFIDELPSSLLIKNSERIRMIMTFANPKPKNIFAANIIFYNINCFFKFNGHFVLIVATGNMNDFLANKEIIERSVATFSKLEQIHLNK